MSAPGKFDVERVARLARVALTAEERARFETELGDVLEYMALLNEVDVSGIEPMAHAFPVTNVWAEDVPQPGLPVEEALRNAPAKHDGMIAVPKVVE